MRDFLLGILNYGAPAAALFLGGWGLTWIVRTLAGDAQRPSRLRDQARYPIGLLVLTVVVSELDRRQALGRFDDATGWVGLLVMAGALVWLMVVVARRARPR